MTSLPLFDLPPPRPSAQPKLPPMLAQYLEYKQQLPECLLFFQVGDFFELFFQDAITVSQTINLTLTSRDKTSSDPVPMCGVPIAAADQYVERLVNEGFSVALVKQFGEVGSKGVQRRLERIVTPGLRVLGAPESAESEGYVAAVQLQSESEAAVALTNLLSGRVRVIEGATVNELPEILSTLQVSELVLPKEFMGKSLDRRFTWVRGIERALDNRRIKFRSDTLARGGTPSASLTGISGYTSLPPLSKRAVQFLLSFVDETTGGAHIQFQAIDVGYDEQALRIDAMTRTNLELIHNAKDGSTRGTLYEYLDKTVSVGGKRLLRSWILQPRLDIATIERRLGSVQEFISEGARRGKVRTALGLMPDIERIASRIELGVVTPRELAALREGLDQLPVLYGATPSVICEWVLAGLSVESQERTRDLLKSVAPKAPLSPGEGGIFTAGASPELDRLIEMTSHTEKVLQEMELRERQSTGVQSLKIRSNSVFGYYIEITTANLSKVPERYIRKQTTAQGERFITEELKKLEKEIEASSSKRILLEREMFEALVTRLRREVPDLRMLSHALSTLDVLASLAERAIESRLVKPVLVEAPVLHISEGFHPQLRETLGAQCIPNDVVMDDEQGRCIVLTGPNMGGKSTYLRQIALSTILAHIGSFVPSAAATIGVVDRVFARLGASDDLHEGESTFMVEMREASSIVHHATERSLVLVDEIGRGTATRDGLSLAQAILEWIVLRTKCRAIFATHFHELTDLSRTMQGALLIENLSVGSLEEDGEVTFTHKIQKGPAKKSYGLEVARLAGLPKELLARAAELCEAPEAASPESPKRAGGPVQTIHLKSEGPEVVTLRKLRERIETFSVEYSTPLEALVFLNELRSELTRGKRST